MTQTTFLYWQCQSDRDGDRSEITIAECPRCGHRVAATGVGIEALTACGKQMRAECPRGEANTYTHEVFPAFGIGLEKTTPPRFNLAKRRMPGETVACDTPSVPHYPTRPLSAT